MKKIFCSIFILAAVIASAAERTEVNEKIINSFRQTFIYAQDPVWQEKDNVYQVNFWQGDINVRATYDDQGTLMSTIRYYFEKQLAPTIVAKLKRKYAGKFIFGVTEVSSDDEVSYFITLQDDKNWYTVKSDVYGNLQQTDKFKKADTE